MRMSRTALANLFAAPLDAVMTATASSTAAISRSGHPRSWRRFGLHYLEMVLAMIAGMAVLGMGERAILAPLGCAALLDHVKFHAPIMATNMTVCMTVWMRYRGHGWPATGEMALAMYVPLAILFGPFAAGMISGSALLVWMHVLMLPAMALVMLRRLDEYAVDHAAHAGVAGSQASGPGVR